MSRYKGRESLEKEISRWNKRMKDSPKTKRNPKFHGITGTGNHRAPLTPGNGTTPKENHQ